MQVQFFLHSIHSMHNLLMPCWCKCKVNLNFRGFCKSWHKWKLFCSIFKQKKEKLDSQMRYVQKLTKASPDYNIKRQPYRTQIQKNKIKSLPQLKLYGKVSVQWSRLEKENILIQHCIIIKSFPYNR